MSSPRKSVIKARGSRDMDITGHHEVLYSTSFCGITANEMLKMNPFGTWGVIFGLLAFSAVFMNFWFGPFADTDTRTLEQKLVDKTVSIKDAISAKIKGQHSPPKQKIPDIDVDQVVMNGTLMLSFLAIILALFSFLKREDLRYTSTALVLGGATLAFHFLLVAMSIVIVLAIIFFVTAQFMS